MARDCARYSIAPWFAVAVAAFMVQAQRLLVSPNLDFSWTVVQGIGHALAVVLDSANDEIRLFRSGASRPKRALEARIRYAYPDQTDLRQTGRGIRPSRRARMLDYGQAQYGKPRTTTSDTSLRAR